MALSQRVILNYPPFLLKRTFFSHLKHLNIDFRLQAPPSWRASMGTGGFVCSHLALQSFFWICQGIGLEHFCQIQNLFYHISSRFLHSNAHPPLLCLSTIYNTCVYITSLHPCEFYLSIEMQSLPFRIFWDFFLLKHLPSVLGWRKNFLVFTLFWGVGGYRRSSSSYRGASMVSESLSEGFYGTTFPLPYYTLYSWKGTQNCFMIKDCL